MRKRIFLMLSMVFVLACMLAFTASADSVHEGKVDLSATVTLDDGTVCNLFDSEGNALIWYISGTDEEGKNIYSSIHSDDPQVIYHSESWCEVTSTRIDLYDEATGTTTTIPSSNMVVINWMDDDVLINECSNAAHIGKPVTGFKLMFQGNKNLEYAYLRLDTTNIQRQNFNGCSNLKYVNLEDLTKLVRIGDGQNFSSCTSLFKGQILDLSRTKLTSIDNGGSFNAVPLAGIIFPSTLTGISNWTFQNSVFETFTYPLTVKTLSAHMFKYNKNLTTVYLGNTLTSIGTCAFHGCTSLNTIFYVGTKDELNTLLDNTSTAVESNGENNNPFWDVVGENRSNLISYADYKKLEDKSGKYVVYDYSYCEAYNEGKHTMSGNATLQFNGYFNEITFADTCSVEGCGAATIDTEKTIGAIFVDYGYSCTEIAINGSYSVSQFFGINQGALADYVGATGNTVEYGLVVSTSDNPLATENSGLIAEGKTYITAQDKFEHDYFAINVIGITDGTIEGTKDTRESVLTFCAYVIDNGTVYYLDGGKTLNVAEQKSYSDVLASQQ